MSEQPPVPKYRLTLTIEGNSHDEVQRELLSMTRGGYLLDSDYESRDAWHVIGGRRTSQMECLNPDQTPEAYAADLDAWFERRRSQKQEADQSCPEAEIRVGQRWRRRSDGYEVEAWRTPAFAADESDNSADHDEMHAASDVLRAGLHSRYIDRWVEQLMDLAECEPVPTGHYGDREADQ